MLSGLRGKGGGYKLTRAPEQYTVDAVLRLTENTLAPVSCLDEASGACANAAECRTIALWQGLDRLISDYLSGVTVGDLMRRESPGDSYVI